MGDSEPMCLQNLAGHESKEPESFVVFRSFCRVEFLLTEVYSRLRLLHMSFWRVSVIVHDWSLKTEITYSGKWNLL